MSLSHQEAGTVFEKARSLLHCPHAPPGNIWIFMALLQDQIFLPLSGFASCRVKQAAFIFLWRKEIGRNNMLLFSQLNLTWLSLLGGKCRIQGEDIFIEVNKPSQPVNTIILIPKETKARRWGALSRKANRKLADKNTAWGQSRLCNIEKKKREKSPLRENCRQFFGLN